MCHFIAYHTLKANVSFKNSKLAECVYLSLILAAASYSSYYRLVSIALLLVLREGGFYQGKYSR